MSSAIETIEEETPPVVDKPANKRRLILISAGVAVLVPALVAGALFSGILPLGKHHGNAPKPVALAEKSVLIDIPDIVTNLDSGARRAVFIKLKAKIELAHASDQEIIAANMPRILDAFQTYLRSMRPEELHGGEGTYRLREALMNRIDVIATPVRVLDVLFVEMLIQ